MTTRTAQEATQFLLAAGKSQQAIAERVGVTQPTISRIHSGELRDPAGSILVRLNDFAKEVESAGSSVITDAASHHPRRRHSDPQ